MDAKFNVITFSKRVIDLNWVVGVAKGTGLNINISQMESVGNWDFEDLTNHDTKLNPYEIMKLLDDERIILLEGDINSNSFGVIINKVSNVYETSFSIDTKYVPHLDSDIITEATKNIYDRISNIILSHEDVNELLYSAMGVEVVLNYSENFDDMYRNSYNIVRWLIGKQGQTGSSDLNGYEQMDLRIWDKTH